MRDSRVATRQERAPPLLAYQSAANVEIAE